MIHEAIAAAERVFVALMLLAGLVGGLCGLLLVGAAWVVVRAGAWLRGRWTGAETDCGPRDAGDTPNPADARVAPPAARAPTWAHTEPTDHKEAA